MRELSVFVDESGDIGGESKYYLIALVFHNQADQIEGSITLYEQALRDKGLANIPLHLTPLLRAQEAYSGMDVQNRSKHLMAFGAFASHSPFLYHVFAYQKDWFGSSDELATRMKRDLIAYLQENLATFQSFDTVKIYYDNGQILVTRVLHSSFEQALGKNAIVYRDANPQSYRLLQVADYVCGIELTALKYSKREERQTDAIFFGKWADFKRNYLKKIRRHLL